MDVGARLAGVEELAVHLGVALIVGGPDGLRLGGHQVAQVHAARQAPGLAALACRSTARSTNNNLSHVLHLLWHILVLCQDNCSHPLVCSFVRSSVH